MRLDSARAQIRRTDAKFMIDRLNVFDDELEELAIVRQGRDATELCQGVLANSLREKRDELANRLQFAAFEPWSSHDKIPYA